MSHCTLTLNPHAIRLEQNSEIHAWIHGGSGKCSKIISKYQARTSANENLALANRLANKTETDSIFFPKDCNT